MYSHILFHLILTVVLVYRWETHAIDTTQSYAGRTWLADCRDSDLISARALWETCAGDLPDQQGAAPRSKDHNTQGVRNITGQIH